MLNRQNTTRAVLLAFAAIVALNTTACIGKGKAPPPAPAPVISKY